MLPWTPVPVTGQVFAVLLCGECKAQLADKVVKFLTDHRAKREKARDKLEKFMIRD